ncbi:MAG: TetR/AcrR family transcriptional regulator [Asticcacaulis sp.]
MYDATRPADSKSGTENGPEKGPVTAPKTATETAAEAAPEAAREENPVPTGSRARSKERNLKKILESAQALFRERGFEAATLRDIARGAGLSTGALFANFTDKHEIFLAVITAGNIQDVAAMRAADDDRLELVDRLHKQLMCGYELAQHNVRIILSAFVMKWSHQDAAGQEVARLSDSVGSVFAETLKKAQAQKQLPEKADIACGAQILEDLCFANMRRAFQLSDDSGSLDLEALSKNIRVQIELVVKALKAA